MNYGVTDKGFIIKPYSVILEELKLLAQRYFGEDIDLSENSRLLRFLEVLAKREDELWQLAEDVFYSGFIQFANGESLDRVVALLGIRRKEGETDEELRYRATRYAPYSKATLHSIKSTLLQIEGVIDVNVQEDLTNHRVMVVIAGGPDEIISQTIEDVRPAGIPVQWQRPTAKSIDVNVKIKVLEGYNASEVQSNVQNAVTNYLNDLHIGEDVIFSDLVKVILQVEGVDDIVSLSATDGTNTINSFGQSIDVAETEKAQAGTITLTVV